LRHYLLGNGTLDYSIAIVIDVCGIDSPYLHSVFYPAGGRQEGHHAYQFTVNGITFVLFLGKRLPSYITQYCTSSAQNPVLYSTKSDRDIVNSFLHLMKTARVATSLKRGQ
jgi:hypothetical protein